MRLVFIQRSIGEGGSKTSLLESLRAARTLSDIQCQVVTWGEGDFLSNCRELGLQPVIAPLPDWRKFFQRLTFQRRMDALAGALRPFAPDYVVSNEMWWAPHALSLAIRLDCQSACIIRDTIAAGPKARQYRLPELHRVLCISTAMKKAMEEASGPHTNLRVVHNAIFPPSVDSGETRQAELEKFPRVRRWLLTIGRVGERKNQVATVETLGRLHEAGLKDCGLVLAGSVDDDYSPQLREAISRLRLEDFVLVAGPVKHIGNLIQRCDASLLTSRREGLPRSIIESFLLGKPCFSTPLPGLDEIYGGPVNYFVSKEDNASALAMLICDALAKPDQLRQHTAIVQENVREKFAPENHWRQMRAALGE